MRTIMIIRGVLLSLALLATADVAACTASRAPSSAGQGNGQRATPASSAPAQAVSLPAGTPSATPAGPGIRNLVIGGAARSELTAAFVAHKGISPSDLLAAGPVPGSVHYAYDPATGTYWALAAFEPSGTASLNVKVNFQDGGNIGMFRKAGAGPWQVQTPGYPPICGELRFFPRAVFMAWALSAFPPPGTGC